MRVKLWPMSMLFPSYNSQFMSIKLQSIDQFLLTSFHYARTPIKHDENATYIICEHSRSL